VLEGISRRTMIELARAHSIPLRIGPLPVADLRRADEVFLSSTGGGAIGISKVDGVPVGGRPAGSFGPVTLTLQQAYWALHEDARFVDAVRYD
jgi:branched-chain amino acid aminotransferase